LKVGLLRAARALVMACALAAGPVLAAPVVLPLVYQFEDGNNAITYGGTVTIDDAIWVPNQDIFELNATPGVLAVNIVVNGPMGYTATFTLAELEGFVFRTNGSNTITDLNFFFNPVGICLLEGVDPFLLAFRCAEDVVPQVTRLLVPPTRAGAAAPVPVLAPALLAFLALALATLAAPALRRRGR
jgi:hypothetical protein